MYFAAEVQIDRSSIPDDILPKLTAGMTTDVMILTGERTVLSYLAEPMVRRLQTTLRER
jgi:multidrug efflux pump subunit AcrA (membrane-fusion protein)